MLMNHHESRTPGVIFTGMWRYKPSHGAVGVLLCAGACILLTRVLLLFFQNVDISPEAIREALALFFGGGLLFYIGTTLLFSLLTGYAKRLVVSEEGIRYANAYFSWKRLLWFDARLKGGTYQICLRKRRGLFRQKWLITDDLSEEQSSPRHQNPRGTLDSVRQASYQMHLANPTSREDWCVAQWESTTLTR